LRREKGEQRWWRSKKKPKVFYDSSRCRLPLRHPPPHLTDEEAKINWKIKLFAFYFISIYGSGICYAGASVSKPPSREELSDISGHVPVENLFADIEMRRVWGGESNADKI
jgi:hypothetical protein